MSDLLKLEEKINIKFNNVELLKTALTHTSFLNENIGEALGDNERLEFLGDAVLELVVTEFLYQNYSNPEGELTNWRAALVRAESLAEAGKSVGLNDFLRLGKGEAKDIGKARDIILSNTIEALIGAIYLDSGYDNAKKFISDWILPQLDEIIEKKLYKDSKSFLQEKTQEVYGITPEYKVINEEGPDHAKVFTMGVFLGNDLIGQGTGESKQEAQQSAAEDALDKKGWRI